jgi:predicted AlkP superfamily pyrophosphatase or phosphodiesterase
MYRFLCPLRACGRALPVVALLTALTSSTTAAAPQRPRLGVLVVFDQLPAWHFERAQPFFGDGGFGGLDGAHLDLWYEYAGTETGPGHATLATGALPAVHGIATNTWVTAGKKQYAVDDAAFPVLAPTPTDPKARASYGRGPARLRVPTLADAMKVDSGGRARIVTLSLKDRAAILTAGHAADLAIWYDPQQGRFTTSTAYADTLPVWLVDVGVQLPRQAMAEGTWSPLPTPRGLEALLPVDDRDGEAAHRGFGRTFPHDLKSVDDEQKASVYRMTPQAIDDLFTLALAAVSAERLGDDDVPDLLVVSVSSTDVIGHSYGADSLESLDLLRRADASLRRFRSALEQRVGRQQLVMAVASDHGGPPLPQAMRQQGLPAASVHTDAVVEVAERAAAAALAPPGKAAAAAARKRVQGFFPPQLFVDIEDLDDAVADRVLAAVAGAVQAVPGIARVYDLERPALDDAFGPLMRASAPPGRAARLFVRQEPRVVFLDTGGRDVGSDHGTPYTYDRRVPFLLAGPGVRRGRFPERADARDVAASLAHLLGVPPPDACSGRPVAAVDHR